MAQETTGSAGSSPRAVATTSRLTGKKLRVSSAEKWARNARTKLLFYVRAVFDVESNWKYRKSALEIKVTKANEFSKNAYATSKKKDLSDWIEITPQVYEETAEQIRDDPRLALALATMMSISFVGQNYPEAIEKAWEKAKAHDDPNKVIGVIKFSLQFVEYVEHLKGLHKNVDKGNSNSGGSNSGGTEPIEGELVDPI